MNELKMKIAIAMNYIPSEMLITKKSPDGKITAKCPKVFYLGCEEWVLKDENLKSEHYERSTECVKNKRK